MLGDPVLNIGSPGGSGIVVTQGILSSLGISSPVWKRNARIWNGRNNSIPNGATLFFLNGWPRVWDDIGHWEDQRCSPRMGRSWGKATRKKIDSRLNVQCPASGL